MTNKTKVLFVCLGNICRSPMGEAIFTHMVGTLSLSESFVIDSAGTSSYHIGSQPDSRSVSACKKHGVPVNHRARQVTKSDFVEFDYILCMDEMNLNDLNRIKPSKSKAKVLLFGEFDPKGHKIIEDPYYGGASGFEFNFQQCLRSSQGFLKHLGHNTQ
ncbi:hypothetical protein BB558_004108 [Smittium angustum]|uniref:Phosphotyrosine protein phosphatase I domain-containing protein n=1 Tax=Smittium angustum TaxID=133377 RepID=A0A2U1J456_SMIAN|nr:hypothetical protein BB558_004108 [Smittium angustum]